MIRVGLIGARGHVGRELLHCLDRDRRFDLAFASSRSMAGRALSANPGLADLGRFGSVVAEDLSPADAGQRDADVLVLGLPNGLSAPYIEVLDRLRHPALVIDLSADHRHGDGWVYGSPELFGDRLAGARRIANPGCYATAANLALAPHTARIAGTVQVFGVSGFSGAGTAPSPRNDPERLEANLQPYGFGGHGHEAEIARTTGLDILFAPHVAPFFRGLVVTLMAPLSVPATGAELRAEAAAFHRDAPAVRVIDRPPEVRDVAGGDLCVIGGFAVSREGRSLTFAAALDNLRKGAATQAIANIERALGLAASHS